STHGALPPKAFAHRLRADVGVAFPDNMASAKARAMCFLITGLSGDCGHPAPTRLVSVSETCAAAQCGSRDEMRANRMPWGNPTEASNAVLNSTTLLPAWSGAPQQKTRTRTSVTSNEWWQVTRISLCQLSFTYS